MPKMSSALLFSLISLACLTGAQVSQPLVDENQLEIQNNEETPPQWSDKMNFQQSVVEPMGSMVLLRCPVTGFPKPQIQWLKDNLPIGQIDRPTKPHKGYQEKKEKWGLKIRGLMKSDEGDYTCVLTNKNGVLRHTFKLEVLQYLQDQPLLMKKSDNLTLLEGMNAHLYCKFKCDLTYSIGWARPAEDIRNGKITELDGSNPQHFEQVKDSNGFNLRGENLTILNVEPEDAGMYFCVAKTSAGYGEPGIMNLNVISKTEAIIQPPQNLTVEIGDKAVFTCTTQPQLKHMVSWAKVGSNLEDLSVASEFLELNNVTYESEGFYACVVGNERAATEEVAFLKVIDKPLPVTPKLSQEKRNHITIAIVVVFVVLLFLIAAILCLFKKFRQEQMKKKQAIESAQALTQWTKKVIIERQEASPESFLTTPIIRIEKQRKAVSLCSKYSNRTSLTNITEYELPMDKDWEFPREQLFLERVIGEGAFGKVMKATASKILKTEDRSTVAVKMLKEGHTDNDVIDLVAEMDLMKMIGRHINIINLLGVCTQDGPLYVVVEFAEHGNLKEFLGKHASWTDGYEKPNFSRPLISEKQLISFARQICNGMEYLGSRKCVHRDLAARNILVDKDYIIKIADFGLARDVQKDDYYRKVSGGFIPIRWMAPESLFEQRYTIQSDVWSFGVTLWEMMSLGARPYPELEKYEDVLAALRKGCRLERPQNCSQEIYTIMLKCWYDDPLRRPSFSDLIESFNSLLLHANEGDYLELSLTSQNCCPLNTGETLIAGSDTMSWDSLMDNTPINPPMVLPPMTSLMTHQHSSSSSGLGSDPEEITYSPVKTGYFSNNLYGFDSFSTFRPTAPPPTNTAQDRQDYANHQQQYSMATEAPFLLQEPPINDFTPADDYSLQFGDEMKTSSL